MLNESFKSIGVPVHSVSLKNRILNKITDYQNKMARIRVTFFSFTLLLVASGMVWSASLLVSSAAETSFLNYVSLLFSDFKFVLSSGGDYAMSLLESFPAFSFGLTAGFIFLFLLVLKSVFTNISLLNIKHHKLTKTT